MILPPDEPVGTRASDALLALDDGYPFELDEQGDPTINGRCLGCGVFWPGDCTCRPGGARPELDDPADEPTWDDRLDMDDLEGVF